MRNLIQAVSPGLYPHLWYFSLQNVLVLSLLLKDNLLGNKLLIATDYMEKKKEEEKGY